MKPTKNPAILNQRLNRYIMGFGQRDSALNVELRCRPYVKPEFPGAYDGPDILEGKSELVKLVLQFAPAARLEAAMEQKRGRASRPASGASIQALATVINSRRH
jgi:hypothetical protein